MAILRSISRPAAAGSAPAPAPAPAKSQKSLGPVASSKRTSKAKAKAKPKTEPESQGLSEVEILRQELESLQAKLATAAATPPAVATPPAEPTIDVSIYTAKRSGKSYPALRVWFAGVDPYTSEGDLSRPSFWVKAADFVTLYEQVLSPDGELIHKECVQAQASYLAAKKAAND